MKITKALQSTAYHEAGHAVVAWRERIKVTAVSIEPDETSGGHVRHKNPLAGIQLDIDNSTRARLRVEGSIRVLLAGAIAQKKFHPRGFRAHHAAEDSERAADLILRIVGSEEEADAYMKLLCIQTENRLSAPMNWVSVVGVAEALLERGNLSGKQAREISRAAIQAAVDARAQGRP